VGYKLLCSPSKINSLPLPSITPPTNPPNPLATTMQLFSLVALTLAASAVAIPTEAPATDAALTTRDTPVEVAVTAPRYVAVEAPEEAAADLTKRADRGSYTVSGLGSRKKAILGAGGNTLDLAIAMLETENMQTWYTYGECRRILPHWAPLRFTARPQTTLPGFLERVMVVNGQQQATASPTTPPTSACSSKTGACSAPAPGATASRARARTIGTTATG